jgi:hypothetical protein
MAELSAEQVDARNQARLRAKDPERYAMRDLRMALAGKAPDGQPLAAPLTDDERVAAEARIEAWREGRLVTTRAQRADEAKAWDDRLMAEAERLSKRKDQHGQAEVCKAAEG